MKKLLLILTIITLLVVGCDSGGDTPSATVTPTTTPTETPVITEEPTPLPHAPTPSPSPTAEPTQTVVPSTTDSPILEMVSIPSGTFILSCIEWVGPNHSGHSVTLSPFDMSTYEITYSQWIKVKKWSESHGYSFNMPGDMGSEDFGGIQDENHPVVDIEWYDAVIWCNALSEMEGRTPCYYISAKKSTVYRSGRVDIHNDWVNWEADGFRLPTDAEWQYACQAGTTTEYSFDVDNINSIDANYNENEGGTTRVGSYASNAWGLFDMHGNVSEWCWDWHGTLSSDPEINPRGPSSGSYRIHRGGSWYYDKMGMRCDAHDKTKPDNSLSRGTGFRPVCSQ